MAEKTLGWVNALDEATTLVEKGELTRSQHMQVFKKFYDSRHEQDNRIAIALLSLFISKYPSDFDNDLKLEDLATYGTKLCTVHFVDFGRNVLYPLLASRSVPAAWIDKIADEETLELRRAFVVALGELAKRKSNPVERILGILRYFLDEPSADGRKNVAAVLQKIAGRDPERVHYFMTEHEKGAGSNRLALFKATRGLLGWKK
jgi:hypothetical protein